LPDAFGRNELHVVDADEVQQALEVVVTVGVGVHRCAAEVRASSLEHDGFASLIFEQGDRSLFGVPEGLATDDDGDDIGFQHRRVTEVPHRRGKDDLVSADQLILKFHHALGFVRLEVGEVLTAFTLSAHHIRVDQGNIVGVQIQCFHGVFGVRGDIALEEGLGESERDAGGGGAGVRFDEQDVCHGTSIHLER
jgi:hypothetical protein